MALDLTQDPGEHLQVANFVWDTGTLAWVKETQAGGGGGGGAVTVADGADVAEGATTDSAVVTDAAGTISGKLRGLVKWAFERMPASLGQTTSANSLPVVVSSDQSAIPVSGTFYQATQPVSGTVAATQSGTWNVGTVTAVTGITNALPAGTNNIGDVDILTLPVDSYSAKSVVASSSGNNTIHTPSGGNKIRLSYIVLSADGANSADVTATVKFAAGGAALYTISLKAGSMWARNVGAGRRYLDGGTNNALIVSLSAAQTVNVSIEYDEST